MVSACIGLELEPPMLEVIWLNQTNAPIATELRDRTSDSSGGASGTVHPCDLGGGATTLLDDSTWTWEITVDDAVVIDSRHPIPPADAGEVVEIIVDVRPQDGAVVRSISVRRALDDPAAGQYLDSLAKEMPCR